MHLLQSLAHFALFSTVVLSAPARPQREGRSFKIERVRQAHYVANGPAALAKAYAKFGFTGSDLSSINVSPKSASSTSTSSPDKTGEVTATPEQQDAEFLAPVQVGGQTLVMNFDTGSSDMWVFNTQLPSSSQQGHTIYDPSKSSTAASLQGSKFNISYGDGSFSQGRVGTDTVNIGGATVTKQAIGLPTRVSTSFVTDTASNGLVGLAFSSINTVKPQQQKTFFDNVMSSLDQPVFTANLKHGAVGAYEFGTIDSSQFQGSLTNVPVDNSRGFWQFSSQAFAVGTGQPQTVQGGSRTAIADTGTSLMLVDESIAAAYYSQVQGSQLDQNTGGFIFPCATTPPDFSVAIGNQYMATIPGSLINFANARTSQTGTQFCFGGVQSNQGNPLQIYGDVFFKSQFVAFDGSGPSIGVAPHK